MRKLNKLTVIVAVFAILAVSFFSVPAAATTPALLLDSNIPRKMDVGQTLYATLTFTSSLGSNYYVDPASLTVTVKDPSNRESQLPLTRIGIGRYAFTLSFPNQGAYYIRVIASLAGYVSVNTIFLVDSVKSATYMDLIMGAVNSPTVYAIWVVVFSVILAVVFKVKKGRK